MDRVNQPLLQFRRDLALAPRGDKARRAFEIQASGGEIVHTQVQQPHVDMRVDVVRLNSQRRRQLNGGGGEVILIDEEVRELAMERGIVGGKLQ